MLRRFILVLCAALAGAVDASAQAIDEYQVKAAFLFNFAKFVEWPARAFATASDPIAICVLGSNPFGHSLEEAVRAKTVDGRSFAIRQIAKVSQSAGCQMLYVSGSRKLVAEQPPPGILLVGESEGFAESGGMIGFKLDNGKVRLEINVEEAEQKKLRISSKLLSLARIVHTHATGDK